MPTTSGDSSAVQKDVQLQQLYQQMYTSGDSLTVTATPAPEQYFLLNILFHLSTVLARLLKYLAAYMEKVTQYNIT